MSRVLVFAGTTEGREISAWLNHYGISSHIFTATEYGRCIIPEGEYLTIESGRLDEKQMEEKFLEEMPELVLDATHPYADVVSANIRQACEKTGREYLRLLRPETEKDASCVIVESTEACVEYLKETSGKVLLTTGSKELAAYTKVPDYQERLYARVLPTSSVLTSVEELGFSGAHIIAMQGPFTQEMNTAMLKSLHCKYLVTKDTGKNGGFEDKVASAKAAGAICLVIARPTKETGYSMEETKHLLAERFGLQTKKKIVIAGIGMGSEGQRTREVEEAIAQADLVIGAKRMLETVASYQKATFAHYNPQVIHDYIYDHPEYENIVLLQSGDVGFYSGAKKLRDLFPDCEVVLLPGISSVVALCAKLGTSWEDVKLLSLHGREAAWLDAIRHNKKVFALVGTKDGIAEICKKLLDYSMEDVRLSVAARLSYEDEEIVIGSPAELCNREFDPLSVVLIENPAADVFRRFGFEDEEFLRDKVPMTKKEIRVQVLSSLQLKPDSIVYDVGSGTGSVSIEMANLCYEGHVYGLEKNPVAVELSRQNQRLFGIDNLTIEEGMAPEGLEAFPAPTHVFVGGSSGNLEEILRLCLSKNPEARIVVTTVTLETLTEAQRVFSILPVEEPDIVCLQATRARKAGRFHLMTAQNPVYIFTTKGVVQA